MKMISYNLIVIVSMIYTQVRIHFDIFYAINVLARYLKNPNLVRASSLEGLYVHIGASTHLIWWLS